MYLHGIFESSSEKLERARNSAKYVEDTLLTNREIGGSERLILGTGGDVFVHRQVLEKSSDFSFAHFRWIPFLVKRMNLRVQ